MKSTKHNPLALTLAKIDNTIAALMSANLSATDFQSAIAGLRIQRAEAERQLAI